ncbi:MAG: type II toxin-antitoxin system PemK/MazF family toxin [Pseudonocardia sp.]
MAVERGEIWWVDLGEPRGSEPALRRPVVIVQSAPFNRSQLRTVICVALTTNARLASMPGNVLLPASVTELPQDSVVNVTQLTAVDRDYLEERTGQVPGWLMVEVDRGLRRVLGL